MTSRNTAFSPSSAAIPVSAAYASTRNAAAFDDAQQHQQNPGYFSAAHEDDQQQEQHHYYNNTNTTNEFVDPSKAQGFLSQLHRRRQEDVSNRAWRQERRADEILHMQQSFRERQTTRRRHRREIKMRFMMPQIEQDVLNTLHEQTQWRHVMFDNVLSREKHIEEVRAKQEAEQQAHLTHMMDEEVAAFEDAKRDDNLRWKALQSNLNERRTREHESHCREIITDICLPLVDKHIDFIELHQDVLAEEKKAATKPQQQQ